MLCDAATGGVFPEAAYQTTCHTYSDAVGCPASTGMQALLELVVEQSRAIQLLQDALDSLPNGFSLSDAGGRLVMCNRAFADLHDREPEAMIGTSRAERVRIFLPNMLQFDGIPMSNSAQDAERWLRRLNRTLSEPVEMELNDGSWKLVTSTPTAEGGRVTICTDISQQKKTEFALYEAQQLLSAFFRHAPIAMNLKDINSRYQMVNKTFTDWYGLSSEQVIGKTMHEFYADDYADAFKGIGTFNVDISMHKQLEDELRNSEALVRQVLEACPVPVTMNRVDDGVIYIKRLRQTRAIDGFEVRYRKTDGEQFRCALSSRLIEYRGEEVVVTSLFDLTERYAVEEELARHREMLHRSEKLSALGELLFSIAHELNNPLSVVTGQTELLQETSDNPRTVARARKIGDAAERCGRIVNTFLAMARQRPLESRAVDLVVLDITMPGEDGLSLARYLREKTASYIVMLTSAGAVVDRIVGLEIGADDYLPKPVILRELHARIRSVLRYGKPPAQAVTQSTASGGNVRFGTCRLHLASQKLYDSRAEEIPLSARELQLLRVFTERPNHSLSRDQIFNLTHNRDWHPCDRSLDLCISRLRRKIEADPANPRVIKTVHGVGYVFAQE